MEDKLESNCDNEVINKFNKAKVELDNYYDNEIRGSIIRSRASWYEYGERSSKYFLGLEKRNKVKSTIRKLKLPDREIDEPNEIMTEIRNFFVDKYSRKISKTSKDCSEFLRTIDLPSLTSDEAGPCGNHLTNEEIWNALNEMQNNKSPGNDGLPSEF